ncbi:MAG: DUF6261 family protein [Prevotellaceae bacterium]|jgi:hypothetical protein|nr:DUF6261 family protein [Prevotellaceae bacterium]
MNKIRLVRVETGRFKNETLYQFFCENKLIYVKYDPVALEIEVFMENYNNALEQFNKALERIRKSPETERIAELDKVFDDSFKGMLAFHKANLRHFDPAIRTAAKNLDVVFKKYGNIGANPYRQQLAMSENILIDLRERPSEVTTTKLKPWMDNHAAKAVALKALLDQRTEETAQQTDVRVSDSRKAIEVIHLQILDRIDAVINLRGKDFVAGFFAEYNAHATEYKIALAQHLGKVRKKNDKEKPAEKKQEE